MSEESCEDVLKLKQIIMGEGLYEAGMTTEDMQQVYRTLNRSKKTANDDNEYRELLSQTDLNCTNVELLTPVESLNDLDKISGTEIKPSEDDEKLTTNEAVTKLNKNKINIVFNFNANHSFNTTVMPAKQNENLIPILYHQEAFLKLPLENKMKVITSYLYHERKKFIVDQTKFLDQWDKPIVLNQRIEFSEPPGAYEEPEIAECMSIATEKNETTSQDFIALRSNRLVKRKNYSEIDSDEDFRAVVNKKVKSTNVISESVDEEFENFNEIPSTSEKSQKEEDDDDDNDVDYLPSTASARKSKRNDSTNTVITNQSTPLSKSLEISKQKWLSTLSKRETNVPKYGKLTMKPEVSDRTNKVFDKLKAEENKNKSTSPKMTSELDNFDEDIFPTERDVSNIHIEITPKSKRGKSITNKKPLPKIRKKNNLRSSSEDKTENNVTEVSTSNFYGKNKENELDASNNNKIILLDKVQCPICAQSFPESEIEYHASRCEQYDDSQEESLCTICNTYILKTVMDAHKFKCLREITEGSTEKSYENKNKPVLGFLCAVCDKYVTDCSQLDHASSCIAAVAD